MPIGWVWTKISNIAFVTKLAGFEYTKYVSPNLCENGIPLFKGKNIQNSEVVYEFESYIPLPISNELFRSQVNRKCILTPYVGTIGNIGVHDKEGIFHLGSNVGKIELFNEKSVVLEEYVVAYLKSKPGYIQLTKHMKATAQASISIEAIRDVIIPLPPSNEQTKICKNIESLNKLIEQIESNQDGINETIILLKSKILDLAIRGKLVPQDPEDEPASVLLERIRAEKEELIKQGKIKRDKNESVIFKGDDNSYYQDIPKSWELVTLGMLTTEASLNDGDWILSENMCPSSNIKLIQLGSVGNMQYIDKGFKYISKETFDELKCTEIYPKHILINRIVSDRMNVCIVPRIEGRLITTVDTCWIAPSPNYNSEYLMYALSSNAFQKVVNHYSRGTTRKRISKGNLIRIAIPFPPIQEQNRIVESINKAFRLLEAI